MFKKTLLITCLFMGGLMAQKNVLVFAGSLRAGSWNKMLAKEVVNVVKDSGYLCTYVDLKDYPMPIYDGDLEQREKLPENAKKLKSLMESSDVVVIVSPEYNASIPAALKNTIDWMSRTEEGSGSKESFKGKVFAIMSTSPGKLGGKRGLVHLRAILTNLDGNVIEQMVSVPSAMDAFDDNGNLIDMDAKERVKEEIILALQTNKS